MKRTLTTALLGAAMGVLSLSGYPALAGPGGPHLNWGSQINPARCPTDQSYRELVINVTHHVVNDADSDGSVAPDSPPMRYWARDDYNRHIQVWEVGVGGGGEELFCALVHYQGSWSTIGGSSPQGTDSTIAAGIEGTFHGGYRAVITGALRPNPSRRTRGSLGTFDYAWNGQPADAPSGSVFDWIDTYFSSVSQVTYEFIGWIYHGGRNGTWVHSCPSTQGNGCAGNQGDITD